ncbi:chromosome segregation protein SMC [Erysipelotrichaceae bacterium OH741_COT-311]|nr:chromosome segregation protein SMC [Erysipelotrichaceae bacterium OH741_COT-311]
MSIKINKLEIENVKRVKAVTLEPTENGLTVIGGRNGQGKTSVIDSVAWLLGGDAFKPSRPQNDESIIPPNLKVTLSNGLIVERIGKNSTLKVTDPSGQKAGQTLLDSFVEKLALNLPKFMQMNNKDKGKTMLRIIGLEKEIVELELKETELYNKRLAIGQIADQKKKFADEQEFYNDVPENLISPAALIKQQQEILARNGENQRLRDKANNLSVEVSALSRKVELLKEELLKQEELLNIKTKDLEVALKTSEQLQDESTTELEQNLQNIEEINAKIRKNLDKEKAEEDAKFYADQYKELTTEIDSVRQSKLDLLNNANLPLPELNIQNGNLIYKGQEWDNMSGSEQLKVATSIVRKINPDCGFVLMDKLEQMDIETMNEFGKWLEKEGLQVIATRVSTGDECSIIIEDGYVKGAEQVETTSKLKEFGGTF